MKTPLSVGKILSSLKKNRYISNKIQEKKTLILKKTFVKIYIYG